MFYFKILAKRTILHRVSWWNIGISNKVSNKDHCHTSSRIYNILSM